MPQGLQRITRLHCILLGAMYDDPRVHAPHPSLSRKNDGGELQKTKTTMHIPPTRIPRHQRRRERSGRRTNVQRRNTHRQSQRSRLRANVVLSLDQGRSRSPTVTRKALQNLSVPMFRDHRGRCSRPRPARLREHHRGLLTKIMTKALRML